MEDEAEIASVDVRDGLIIVVAGDERHSKGPTVKVIELGVST